MNLDDRARRAAADLRNRTGRDVDVEDALDAVVTGSVAPMPRGRLLVTSAVTVAVLALVGGLVAVSGRGSEDAQPPRTTSTPTTSPDDTDVEPTPEQLLELMPAGPIDGKESWRLPVLMTPQAGVTDGQTVTALGKGFVPGEQVGIVMCTAEAAVEGVAACDLGTAAESFAHVTYATAEPDGSVQSEFMVRQQITTPFTGPVDCSSAAERCLVAIGAVSDYDRSGGSFVGFAGAPPFPEPTLVVEPPGPYNDGQLVSVRVAGLVAPRDVQVLQCRDLFCVALARGLVAADGTFSADVTVAATFVDQFGAGVACDDLCVIGVTGIGLDESTAAPMPPPVALGAIVPKDPPATDPAITAPVPTAPTPTEPVPTEPASTDPVPIDPEPIESTVATTPPGI